ncbi:MAG: hypothetical protein LUE91_02340 [Oscillospiraceae bacterium]|nr:hypothetical protein [Oscillospiraceae bacterium]
MAFYLYSTDDNRVPGVEYLPCGAITPKAGMLLTLSGGLLALCGGTTAPSYLSMCQRDEACQEGEIIPMLRVGSDMIFEVPGSVSLAALVPGDLVTVGADGLTLTATTTGGVAEVVHVAEDGARARVRF